MRGQNMKGALEQQALTQDKMVLQDAKQQVLGRTKHGRDVSEAVGGDAVSIATYLGVHHYGYGSSYPEMHVKLAGGLNTPLDAEG